MGPLFFLLLLAVPVGEIILLVKVGNVLGFLRVVIYLMLMGFLGTSLIKAQGRDLMVKAQGALLRGEVPTGAPLHGLLGILGGILFVIPGIMSDVVGLLCILPGTKHLLAFLMQGWLAKQVAKGRMHVFGKMGGFGAGGGFGGMKQDEGFGPGPEARDVSPKVIDVTPIKSDSTEGGRHD